MGGGEVEWRKRRRAGGEEKEGGLVVKEVGDHKIGVREGIDQETEVASAF